jgi:PAS domain S-box-containing protein
MKTDLHILMLEDEVLDAELNKAQLQLLDEYNCIVLWVTGKEAFLEALHTYVPDIVLSDYNLPQYNGIEALNDLYRINPLIPFIFVTGTINEETAAGTIKAGAWDYVVKDRLFRLPLAIRSVLKLKSERVNTAKAEEQNRKLSQAVEQSPAHIVIINIERNIEYVNARFIEVTGFLQEEVIGKDPCNIIPGKYNEDYLSDIWDILKSGFSWRGEAQNIKKDGSVFWESISISSIKNEKGEITHFVAVKEDITQRKKMEQDLIEARDRAQRSDNLKEAFLHNLSHEIRTPLNAIVGFSSLLNDRNINSEKTTEYSLIIQNSSNQLLSIVSDVLTISRIQTGQEIVIFNPININELYESLYTVLKLKASAKNLVLKLNIDKNLPDLFVLSDETKLTQILVNFINNAIKFTNEGSIEFGYYLDNKEIKFYVKDTGIGIEKHNQQHIFERFRQADNSISVNYGGTGLGLSISRSYAEMLKGTISVESEAGKGSTFTLTLPFERSKTKFQEKVEEININNGQKQTVLVAEDEEFNFMLIETLLNDKNYIVIHAHNGKEAVELCNKQPNISLILMDIKMPEMDGSTAMLEIRKFRPNLPIIAQTAYALEQEKQHFLETGFDDYLPKPIKKEDLWEKVHFLLQQNKK